MSLPMTFDQVIKERNFFQRWQPDDVGPRTIQYRNHGAQLLIGRHQHLSVPHCLGTTGKGSKIIWRL